MKHTAKLSLKLGMALGLAAILTTVSPPARAYSGEQYVVCKLNPNGDNFLALRSCGSSKCNMMAKLGPGTFLMSTEPYSEKGWRQVIVQRNMQDESYSGPMGWVYDKYICEIRY